MMRAASTRVEYWSGGSWSSSVWSHCSRAAAAEVMVAVPYVVAGTAVAV